MEGVGRGQVGLFGAGGPVGLFGNRNPRRQARNAAFHTGRRGHRSTVRAGSEGNLGAGSAETYRPPHPFSRLDWWFGGETGRWEGAGGDKWGCLGLVGQFGWLATGTRGDRRGMQHSARGVRACVVGLVGAGRAWVARHAGLAAVRRPPTWDARVATSSCSWAATALPCCAAARTTVSSCASRSTCARQRDRL